MIEVLICRLTSSCSLDMSNCDSLIAQYAMLGYNVNAGYVHVQSLQSLHSMTMEFFNNSSTVGFIDLHSINSIELLSYLLDNEIICKNRPRSYK